MAQAMALPKISHDELIRRLSDPDEDLDALMPYLIEVPQSHRMAPVLQPNPSLVTDIPPQLEGGVFMWGANTWHRERRRKAYRKRLSQGWDGARIVSEGDSWFQYPTSLLDIIDHLMTDHAILSLGAAGDLLDDMIRRPEIVSNVTREGAHAVLLSAGGNDLFNDGNIARLIEPFGPGATPDDMIGGKFDAFLGGIIRKYRGLLRYIHTAHPRVHILMHGYGPAYPRDNVWIQRPLAKIGIGDLAVQHAIIKIILRKFNAALSSLSREAEWGGMVEHLDVTDIGKKYDEWHDEIHLNGPTAAKVADRFRKVLKRRLGPQPEGGLESGVDEDGLDATDDPFPAITEHALQLSKLDEGALEAELDLRLAMVTANPGLADEPALPLMILGESGLEGGITEISAATRRLLRRWERELYDLICEGAEAESKLAKAVSAAINSGEGALVKAIAAWLATGPLGVPAALAGALAAWLAKRVLRLGKDQLCPRWKERVDASA